MPDGNRLGHFGPSGPFLGERFGTPLEEAKQAANIEIVYRTPHLDQRPRRQAHRTGDLRDVSSFITNRLHTSPWLERSLFLILCRGSRESRTDVNLIRRKEIRLFQRRTDRRLELVANMSRAKLIGNCDHHDFLTKFIVGTTDGCDLGKLGGSMTRATCSTSCG